jgi:hypothetical protein
VIDFHQINPTVTLFVILIIYILFFNKNRWQSPEKATRDESRAQIRPSHWWGKKTAQIPPRYRRVERNPQVPKVHGIAHPKVAVPTIGERNRARFQNGLAIPILGGFGVTRSVRGVLGWLVRRHQLVRDPRQESHHHAEGCPIGETNQRRTRLRSLITSNFFFCVFGVLEAIKTNHRKFLLPPFTFH